jgi:hypothetical protein
MPVYIKCRYCNGTEDKKLKDELMECEEKYSEETKKTSRKYFHKGECWEKHLENQVFIEKELREKDELNLVIKSIHSIKFDIPPNVWVLIQDLRNGTNRYQSFFKKKYKAGVPYPVIAEAYRMSKDSIEWSKMNRRFKTKVEEMRYSLKIVQSKLEDAYRKIQRTEQSQTIAKAKEKSEVEAMIDNRQVEFKDNKKYEFDISDILGDD